MQPDLEDIRFYPVLFFLEWIEWNRVEIAIVSAIMDAPCDALKILVVPLSLAGRGGGGRRCGAAGCLSVLWPVEVAGGEVELMQVREWWLRGRLRAVELGALFLLLLLAVLETGNGGGRQDLLLLGSLVKLRMAKGISNGVGVPLLLQA